MGEVALVATYGSVVALSSVRAADATQPIVIANGVRLERVHFNQSLLPAEDQAGFGTLLFDVSGKLVLHERSKTWLFTTGLAEPAPAGKRNWYGQWISHVREFDVRTLAAGPRKVALRVSGGDRWSVIHDVIQVTPELFVAFYSANGGVRAAVSRRPDGPFRTVPGFKIQGSDAWERAGGNETSLESNGAHVLIDEDARAVAFWLGYDSYHVDRTAGQLGWAQVRVDKLTRTVEYLGKNPSNPLPLLREGYLAARCGGNLSTDVELDHQRAFSTTRDRTSIRSC